MATDQHAFPALMETETSGIGSLRGKVALVTGSSSGIGRAIVMAFAKAGAYVVSADITPNPPVAPHLAATLTGIDLTTPTADLANKLWPAYEGALPRAVFARCDVSNEGDVEAVVQDAVDVYGRLDIMVNNAGISAETTVQGFVEGSDPVSRIHETDVSVLDRTFRVNIRGVWLGCKHAAKQMMSQCPHGSGDRGWIVNVSSMMGSVGMPGSSSYCGSKGAVLQFTRAVALEYAEDKIHVNCIQPGFIETGINENVMARHGRDAVEQRMRAATPWGRTGLPEEVAGLAVFLAGSGASWVTGASFAVDGGYTAQ